MKNMAFLKLLLGLFSFLVVAQSLASQDRGSFKDERDAQSYGWIKIGDQIWMSQNLNFKAGKGSFCYDNDSMNCSVYGRLYDWATALKVCPAGWHLPTYQDWVDLSAFLDDQAGEKLKERGNDHWNGPDAVVRGDSGFNALPAGFRGLDQAGRPFFSGLRDMACYWSSSSAKLVTKGRAVSLTSTDDLFHLTTGWKTFAYSVRCIKEG